ncbi:universal stress protein [Alicyclobacillus fodiniaquatilis]|jgi:nucleotide-binding universal stress UspA family protein|uniref:Universal stress protein n=1 Tax=Alicyclobacillus fodiniaquatilis TaxID=1661150 RepID=A0ABW4JH92_9BACL
MYRRILVPVDDAETMDVIMHEVFQMCEENKNRVITLFHVLRPVNSLGVGTGYVVNSSDVQADLEQEGYQILEQARKRLFTVGVEPKLVLKWGDPAHEISQYAEHEKIDLIVVGNKDKGLLEKLLSSSVSQKVVQEASTHVLVVK